MDIAALRAPFDRTDATTIGVEEEFFLLDGDGPDVAWDAPALLADLRDERFKGELPSSQIEHVTPPCGDLADLAARLRRARLDMTARTGRRFAGAGTHPLAARVLQSPGDARYRETFRLHPWAADHQMVAALQVHVAVGPADVALAVHDALRSYLPDLVALAACSPFAAGEDTGLACVRPLISTLLPRQGIPPALGSWEGYAQMRRWMERAGNGDERRIWWEVRLRPDYGTLEVRAMDSQASAGDAATVTALTAAVVRWLADRATDGETLPVHPTERIAENRWRAVRDGGTARLLDLDTGEEEPVAARLDRLVEAVGPAAEALGGQHLLDGVAGLSSSTGAARQRVAAEHGGPEGATAWLADVFAV